MKPGLVVVFGVIWKQANSVQRGWRPLLAQEDSHLEGQEGSRNSPLPEARGEAKALKASLELGDLVQLGHKQGGIESAGLLERLGVDGDVDQGIEPTH